MLKLTNEEIIKGVDKLMDECYSKELSACSHAIFQRQKFLNKLLPYLDSVGVVRNVDGQLPESRCFHWYNDWGGECGRSGFELALREIVKAGYVAVIPLVEDR